MLLYKPFLCTCLQRESCSWMAETPPGRHYGELSVPKSWPSLPFSEREREKREFRWHFPLLWQLTSLLKWFPEGEFHAHPTHTHYYFCVCHSRISPWFIFLLLADNCLTMLSHTFNCVYFNSFFNLLLEFLLQSLFFRFSFMFFFQFPIP